jgi:hypothetical protein
VQFSGFAPGHDMFIATGTPNLYELVVVPEPSTVLGAAFVGLLAVRSRRRRRTAA